MDDTQEIGGGDVADAGEVLGNTAPDDSPPKWTEGVLEQQEDGSFVVKIKDEYGQDAHEQAGFANKESAMSWAQENLPDDATIQIELATPQPEPEAEEAAPSEGTDATVESPPAEAQGAPTE